VCSQGAFRLDGDTCGLPDAAALDESLFDAGNSLAAGDPAPRATEPEDAAIESTVTASRSPAADVGNDDVERGGMLSALATAVERTPGAGAVRQTLSAGAMEASRALAVVRHWLAGPRQVATVEPPPPPTPTEATEKLYDWFGVDSPGELAGHRLDCADAPEYVALGDETAAHPAVTRNLGAAEVAQIDSLVPAEAFSTGESAKPGFIDWEAEVAQAHEREAALQDDPRKDVITPTIRTAAVALERLGEAAISLSGRLRGLAETTAVR
jgi:hypothetical protein